MLTPKEKEELKKILSDCESVKDVFDKIGLLYDLDTAKLGFLTKGKVIEGAIETVHILNPKKKFNPNFKVNRS